MSRAEFNPFDQSISPDGQSRRTLSCEQEPPPETSRLQNRVTIQADRIDRLVAALRDCQVRLAAANERDALMAERAASTTWRIVETISHVNARIAPLGSRRRSLLLAGYRTLRALSRFRSPGYSASRIRSFVDRVLHWCFHAVFEAIRFHREVRFNPPRIPTFSTIRASIIIFSDSTHDIDTLSCLKSIVNHDAGIGYEVLVVDESSTGRTWRRLHRIPGLVVLQIRRFTESLASSIAGAAVGDYLVFLENTALVTPGWLAAMVETFRDQPLAGMAVPKLIHPDGRLKEAGGAGPLKSANPDHPRYNFACELDLCSATCVVVRRDLFNEIGELDRRQCTHEDAVSAVSSIVRQSEKKLVYQPMARIIHRDRLRHGKPPAPRGPVFSAINQPHFHVPTHSEASRGRVLVIDHAIPTPDQDSGSLRMMGIIRAIRAGTM